MTRSVDDADNAPAGDRATADQPVNEVDLDAFGAWYRWRHNRPFWGGLLVVLGSGEILLSERAPIPVVIHVGIQGLAGYLVPAIMLLCGLLLWFSPEQRTFYSILAVLLSLGSWVTSNLGGFFVGMALGLVGGSLGFAWARSTGPPRRRSLRPPPRTPPRTPRRREPSGGLDLILGGPRKSSRPVRAPARRQRSTRDDTEHIGNNPRRQDAAAPDQRCTALAEWRRASKRPPARPGPVRITGAPTCR